MTAFYLWLKQDGTGCDYTIGCGEKMTPLKAETIEEALKEAGRYLDGEYYDLTEIKSALLLAPQINLMPNVNATLHEIKLQKEMRKLEKKRQQLEELKRELGEK
jgi:cell division protein ZapA (FtsZ GTPase activity inhibitor)